MSRTMCEEPLYVRVLYDFDYDASDGKKVRMKEGEEFLLLNKTNNDWWQVIRDGDKRPFYAPASYMEEMSFEQTQNASNKKRSSRDGSSPEPEDMQIKSHSYANISESNNNDENRNSWNKHKSRSLEKVNKLNSETKSSHGLLFSNPLYSVTESLRVQTSSRVEPDTDYTDDEEESKCKVVDNSVVSSRECHTVQEVVSSFAEERFQRSSISPIYANLPLNSPPNPPSPTDKETPTKILLHHWAEFEDSNGRKYYYNCMTREKSWKPPRRRSEKLHSASSSSLDLSSYQNEDSVDEKTDSSSLSTSLNSPLLPLPTGWSQSYEEDETEPCFVNDITQEKWFSSTDEQGRLYFYQENACESFWQLPEVILTEISGEKNAAENDVKPNNLAREGLPPLTRSPSTSPNFKRRPHLRPASLADRGLKARSMIITDNRCSSLPRNSSGLQFNLHAGHLKISRQGMLNKTKLIEGGKRLRKSWNPSFIILSDLFLLFYKDMKAAQLSSPASKPEICIDLAGALIEWTPEKSSRKNVFQISTVLGLQVLVQDESTPTSKEWFEAIRSAISKLPSGFALTTSKPSMNVNLPSLEETKKSFRLTRRFRTSESQEDLESTSAERKVKIKDKLINFFLRRPHIELLRERGILKEEPVFGCNLHTLCAREKTTVPRFVQKCTKLIETKDVKADGLYRASGNLSQVQKIRFQVNQDKLLCLDIEEDVHVITGALKMFFRELKEPLIPFSISQKLLQSIMSPDKSTKLQSFSELILSLPRPNYDTLKFLLQHLLRVTEYSEHNRMHIQNLAIVFGPTLMWAEGDSNNLALDMMQQNQIIEYLLVEFPKLFR